MSKRILLVEDEPGLVLTLTDRLTSEGYEVTSEEDGDAGSKNALSNPYDLFILDVMLPGRSGLDICQDIRKKEIQTPILMLTARGQVVDKVVGLKLGADDYLTKPFAFEELLARIKVMQRRSNSNIDGEEMNIGPIILNLAAHEARVSDQLLDLTQREFALLEYLMRYAGKTVSRERIIENAWGPSSDITSNAVDVYVGYLRKKIDAVSDEIEIRTVRGIGFKLMIKEQA